MSKRLLFAYGSLRSGFGNHCVLGKDSDLLGLFKTEPVYEMLDLGAFPGVIEGGSTSITGEVWAVDDSTWNRVEVLEGYPNFYNRISFTTDYGEATMYVLDKNSFSSRGHFVKSGDWAGKD